MMHPTTVWIACFILSTSAPGSDESGCTCAAARLSNEWCASCKVGYVTGLPIGSKLLFEELDPHGHDINPQALHCGACLTAFKSGGFCAKCGMGYVRGQAYLSPLTYHLARGKPVQTAKLACTACRKHSAKYGWCEACRLGFVGHTSFRSREIYDRAVKAYQVVLFALDKLDKCKMCAVAVVTGGRCPDCKISYAHLHEAVGANGAGE